MKGPLSLGSLLCISLTVSPTLSLNHHHRHRLARLPSLAAAAKNAIQTSEAPRYPAYSLSVPVDHFHNESKYEPHSNDNFDLRYWFDPQFYKSGGPVIVLASGEISGETRLDFLERGIAHILAKETNGIALVLEHRYYGESYPFSNSTVESLRFLDTEQALADTAYFAEHVQFPGLEDKNLTAPSTPWIIYGGSYAGAFAALARKLYPDAFWGGISSSGVTLAVLDYWAYTEAQRLSAPGACANNTGLVVDVVDKVLLGGDQTTKDQLKEAFGLPDLKEDGDFVETIGIPILGLQQTNWDFNEEDPGYAEFCSVVQAPEPVYSSVRHLRGWVGDFITAAGYKDKDDKLTTIMLNYIGYVRAFVKKAQREWCPGKSQYECFERYGKLNSTEIDPIGGYARSWTYQMCTQWGFFLTGSGTPPDRLPLYSRIADLDWATAVCPIVFNITTPPDLESINKYGGLDFGHSRLAFVDGAQDPWRAAGPHAIGGSERKNTDEQPFLLVDPGVHHWEEYGAKEEDKKRHPDFPPQNIVDTQAEEVRFVKVWLKEFEDNQKKAIMVEKEESDLPGEL